MVTNASARVANTGTRGAMSGVSVPQPLINQRFSGEEYRAGILRGMHMEPLSRRTVLIAASAGLTVFMATASVHAGNAGNGNVVGASLPGLGIGAI
jgi:hypothetical protein